MPAGDPVFSSDVELTEDRPVGRLVANASQALANSTQVAIAFAAEDFDSHAQHSTSVNTSRVTPNVAGIYRIDATGFFEGQAATTVESDINIRINGTTNIAPGARVGVPPATQAFSLSCTVLFAFNGTTDYFELMMRQQSNAADNTNQSIQFSSTLQWVRERGLI